MDLLRRLFFTWRYLFQPTWDTGVVPPEVEQHIRTEKPARALDLGCGTGTSSLALAVAGWDVTGVDFVPRAIRRAKQKAARLGVPVRFLIGDVSRLPTQVLDAPYALVLDIGCFHALTLSSRQAYLSQLRRLLQEDGIWLVYTFLREEDSREPGISPEEMVLIEDRMTLVTRSFGHDRGNRSSAWLKFKQKREPTPK